MSEEFYFEEESTVGEDIVEIVRCNGSPMRKKSIINLLQEYYPVRLVRKTINDFLYEGDLKYSSEHDLLKFPTKQKEVKPINNQ